MDNNQMVKQMKAERFKRNNGKVMLAVNVLRHEFIALPLVFSVLEKQEKMSEGEFVDSIHFLHGNGYIELRKVHNQAALQSLAGTDYRQLEAIVTQTRGVRLLADEIQDKAVILEW